MGIVVISPGLVLPFTAAFRRVSPWILWESKITFTNIVADEEDSVHPVTNLWNPVTSSYWMGTSTAAQGIRVSGLTGMTDALGVARHNFGTAQIELEVWGINAASAPDFVKIHDGLLPTDDTPILFKFTKDVYSDIELRMASGGAIPYAAILMIGELLVLPTGIQPGYTPLRAGRQIELSVGQSQSGEHLGSWVLSAGLKNSTSIKELSDSFYNDSMREFLDAADLGQTFFFAWAPIVRPLEVGYCWFDSNSTRVISRSRPTWDVDMNIGGIL